MKPTREEMVAIFRQVTDEEPLAGGWPVLEHFALAMYRKGQEDMLASEKPIGYVRNLESGEST